MIAPNSVAVASTSLEIENWAIIASAIHSTNARDPIEPSRRRSTSSTNTGSSGTSASYGPPVRWVSMYGENP